MDNPRYPNARDLQHGIQIIGINRPDIILALLKAFPEPWVDIVVEMDEMCYFVLDRHLKQHPHDGLLEERNGTPYFNGIRIVPMVPVETRVWTRVDEFSQKDY